MAKLFIEDTTLTSIGDAIRSKAGTTEKIPPLDMATAITNLPSGGGGMGEHFALVAKRGEEQYRQEFNTKSLKKLHVRYKMVRTDNVDKMSVNCALYKNAKIEFKMDSGNWWGDYIVGGEGILSRYHNEYSSYKGAWETNPDVEVNYDYDVSAMNTCVVETHAYAPSGEQVGLEVYITGE